VKAQFPEVQALIFDLDGTLIDSKLDLVLAINATRHQMRLPALDHELICSYVGEGMQKLIERAMGEGVTPAEIERATAFFLDYYRRHMLDNTVTYPGVREALASFDGRPMAVLTNKPVKISRAILDGLGISHFFRQVYGGNSFETKKPDPLGMNTLLEEFGLAPRQTMLVGDSITDVQTARNADTWVAAVTYGLGSHRLDELPPDILLDSLTQLPAYLNGAAA
jgi:phosphoglycolate phosphatase